MTTKEIQTSLNNYYTLCVDNFAKWGLIYSIKKKKDHSDNINYYIEAKHYKTKIVLSNVYLYTLTTDEKLYRCDEYIDTFNFEKIKETISTIIAVNNDLMIKIK